MSCYTPASDLLVASPHITGCRKKTAKFFLPAIKLHFSDKEGVSKEGKSEPCLKKKKTNQHSDSSDVNSKVCDFHARGKLQSLTVPDLKRFLAGKKVKVGGKKEELVQRVTAILSSKENFS